MDSLKIIANADYWTKLCAAIVYGTPFKPRIKKTGFDSP